MLNRSELNFKPQGTALYAELRLLKVLRGSMNTLEKVENLNGGC